MGKLGAARAQVAFEIGDVSASSMLEPESRGLGLAATMVEKLIENAQGRNQVQDLIMSFSEYHAANRRVAQVFSSAFTPDLHDFDLWPVVYICAGRRQVITPFVRRLCSQTPKACGNSSRSESTWTLTSFYIIILNLSDLFCREPSSN